jgi:hypothetical protein
MPRFSVRSLFAWVTATCIVVVALMNPSIWWSAILPLLATMLTTFCVTKSIFGEGRTRAFWASFGLGFCVYLAMCLLVSALVPSSGPFGEGDIWASAFGEWTWNRLHGQVPRSNSIINDLSRDDFASFVMTLHFAMASLVSSVVAFGVVLIVGRRQET